jgi:hypothetical protein
MAAKYWLIQGFDGNQMIYEKKLEHSRLTQLELENLLKALVSQAGLSREEIVHAYAKGNTLLQVTRDGPGLSFSCGESPFFTARLI